MKQSVIVILLSVIACFALNILGSTKTSRTFFLTDMYFFFISSNFHAKKKYSKRSKSFILKILFKELLTISISLMLFSTSNISYIYIRREMKDV